MWIRTGGENWLGGVEWKDPKENCPVSFSVKRQKTHPFESHSHRHQEVKVSRSKGPFVLPSPLAEEARKESSFYYFFFSLKNYPSPENHTDWEAEVKKNLETWNENWSDKLVFPLKSPLTPKGKSLSGILGALLNRCSVFFLSLKIPIIYFQKIHPCGLWILLGSCCNYGTLAPQTKHSGQDRLHYTPRWSDIPISMFMKNSKTKLKTLSILSQNTKVLCSFKSIQNLIRFWLSFVNWSQIVV